MSIRFLPRAAALVGSLLLPLPMLAEAQGQVRSAQRVMPSAAARAAQAAPNPAGLRPPVPAGLTSGSGAAVATDPVAASAPVAGLGTPNATAGATTPETVAPGMATTGPGLATVPGGTVGDAIDTRVLGAGAAPGYGFVRGPQQTVPTGALGLNAVELARAFLGADRNGDGELSRSEAQRLSLGGLSFEEMDRDFDGVISRGEFEDGLR